MYIDIQFEVWTNAIM